MRLYMHITSQSFVQSYRRFERNSYVHTSSTSDTAGIGFHIIIRIVISIGYHNSVPHREHR